MKTRSRIGFLILVVFTAAACSSARADTLPAGAGPNLGNLEGVDILTPLLLTISDGRVFVLTDFECLTAARIFSADDPETEMKCRAAGSSGGSMGRSLQTRLVFSAPPLISAAVQAHGLASPAT